MTKEQHRLQRLERKEKGLCTKCGLVPSHQGQTMCQHCQDAHKRANAAYYTRFKKDGKCVNCSKPCDKGEGYSKCQDCCDKQLTRDQQRAYDRRALGLCTRCGKNPAGINCYTCVTCYLKYASTRLFGRASHWHLLLNLFQKQHGKCPYFGCQLTLGEDTELDHIVAVTKGGTNDISNLQWVHVIANRMKFNQSEEEFVKNAMRIVANKGAAYSTIQCRVQEFAGTSA